MSVMTVKIEDLKVDHSYQRELDQKRVKNIADKFNPELAGTIIVSRREDGSLYIIDGNHRVNAMKLIGKKYVMANILENLTIEEEAADFYKLNTLQKKPSFNEILVASITAKNEEALKYKETLDMSGVKYSFGTGNLSCFSAHHKGMRSAKRYGHKSFIQALRICKLSKFGYDGRVVCALTRIYFLFPNIDNGHLQDILEKTTLNEVAKTSLSFSFGALGTNPDIPFAKAILFLYNKRLRENKKLDMATLDKKEAKK